MSRRRIAGWLGREPIAPSGNPAPGGWRAAFLSRSSYEKEIDLDSVDPEINPAAVAPSEALTLDEQVGHLIRRAHQRASSIFLSQLSDYRLTPAQFFAMARLHQMGDISQNRLGRMVSMDPATIQGVVRRLEERGLIARRSDPTDRRRMIPKLTAAGRKIAVRLLDSAAKVDEAILAPLTPDERSQFLSLLKRLV